VVCGRAIDDGIALVAGFEECKVGVYCYHPSVDSIFFISASLIPFMPIARTRGPFRSFSSPMSTFQASLEGSTKV